MLIMDRHSTAHTANLGNQSHSGRLVRLQFAARFFAVLVFAQFARGQEVSMSASYQSILILELQAQAEIERGRCSAASPFFERAIAMCDSLFPDSLDVRIRLRTQLADAYGKILRRKLCDQRVEEVAELSRRLVSCPDTLRVWILHGRAGSYSWQGRIAEAETYYEEILDFEASSPEFSAERRAGDEFWYAMWLEGSGRLEDAEQQYRNCEALIWTADPCDGHPSAITVLLASNLSRQGRHAEAIEIITKENELAERCTESGPCDLARGYAAATEIFHRAGQTQESIDSRNQAIYYCWKELSEQAEEVNSGDIYVVGQTVRQLSRISTAWWDLSSEDSLMQRVVELTDSTNEPNWPDTYLWMAEWARIARERKDYGKADSLYDAALAFYQGHWGVFHSSTARLSAEAGLSALLQSKLKRAVELARSAYSIQRDLITSQLQIASEHDALEMAAQLNRMTNIYLSSVIKSGLQDEVCDLILDSKGQVSSVFVERAAGYELEGDAESSVLADSLRWARAALSALFVQGAANSEEIRTATQAVQKLQAEFSKRFPGSYAGNTRGREGVDAIVSSLPAYSSLIEFRRFVHIGDRDEERYLAIVVRGNGEHSVIELGKAAQIDSLIEWYAQEMSRPETASLDVYRMISARLLALIWAPIEAAIGTDTLVFIAPDGELNRVSFAGIMRDDGKFLIEDYTFHYLNAGRDLLRNDLPDRFGHGLVSFGDPDFGEPSANSLDVAAVSKRIVSASGIQPEPMRNLRSSCERLNNLHAARLPGSALEVNSLAETWKEYSCEPTEVFVGKEATEERLKRDAVGCRVLHIATHGFYIGNHCASAKRGELGVNGMAFSENPLLRSGFLLAGANRASLANELGIEDGVVTAEEIASLNLAGTELAILSCCESGSGDIRSGEGVMGLSRSFRQAGVASIVSSLWPLSDATASEMLPGLVANLETPLPMRVRMVQLTLLESLRATGDSVHPVLWASLVSSGYWK